MIKLNRDFTPIFLTPKKRKELTDLFIQSNIAVWDIKELKEALLTLSNNKCCYCECDIKEESKYMEVEHFENKKYNAQKVIDWDNLLPSCKRCNGAKSTHNVIIEPIINPFSDNPPCHLKLHNYRLAGKTSVGKQTIDVVDLNNSLRAVKKRFEIGDALLNLLISLADRLESYKEKQLMGRKNKLLGLLEGILLECQKEASYTATSATILHTSEDYNNIVVELKQLNLWTTEHQDLHESSRQFILI